MFYEIQQGLSDMAQSQPEDGGMAKEPLRLMPQDIGEVIAETEVPEAAAAMIEESYREEFQEEAPILDYLIDPKAVEAGSRRRQERELVKKVATLEKQLADSRMAPGAPEGGEEGGDGAGGTKTYDVILRVKPEKASQIKSQLIDGRKCLVIPMDENEHAAINGVNTKV